MMNVQCVRHYAEFSMHLPQHCELSIIIPIFFIFTWGKWDLESLGDLLKGTQLGNGKTRTETLKPTPDLILYVFPEWMIYLDSDILAYCTSNVVIDNWIFSSS